LQQLSLVLGNDSWVEIVDANDDVLLADLKPAGSVIELNGRAPFEVLLGNGVGTQVSFGGEMITVPVNLEDNTARWIIDN